MKKDNASFKTEYSEMLDFILELQELALTHCEEVFSRKKELKYKKRQQEFLFQENEKKRTPNISMFSPLSTEESYEEDIQGKKELEKIELQLASIEEEWEKQKKICNSFERLKTFFLSLDKEQKRDDYQEEKSNLMSYSTKLLETQEMDRNRISRDLHDSTVQGLTTLVHKTEFCSKLIDKDPVRVKLELQSMIDLNKEIINDMREIIYDLSPMSLNNIGLVSTVESYCLHLRRKDSMDIVLSVKGKERQLSSIVSVTLYRIIQEACNNAVRHSKAKRVYVKISFLEHNIEIDIEDNGVGFDINQVENRTKEDILHGFGLSTMRERARLLSGTFSIDSKPGAGTKIRVFVPVNYTSRKEESYE